MHFNVSPVYEQYDFHCLTHPALDVCGFNQLKKAFRGLLVKRNLKNHDRLTKANIMEVLGPAYYAALTPENVKASFKATGIHPFNPEVITEDKMAPSLATAKTNPFPGTTPIAIKKTVDFLLPELSTPFTPIRPLGTQPDTKESPLHIYAQENHAQEPSQPPLDAANVLRDSEIGFIYQSRAITSSQPLPSEYIDYQSPLKRFKIPPTHCQGSIAELKEENKQLREELDNLRQKAKRSLHSNARLNMQVAIQHVFLTRLRHQLAQKEMKKSANRNKINQNGRGVILTSNEIREIIAEQQEGRIQKAAAKLCRAEARQVNKTTRKTKDELNAVKRAEWQAKRAAYDTKCEKLQRQGVPKSQWPRAPWYPFGKKSYEQWLAEGDEPEYDEKVSFDEGPSWKASDSGEGSTEESECEDEDQ